MRASEFISEGKKGKLGKRTKKAIQGVWRTRDVGGYDRTNHGYRMGMAMAMSDGSGKAVDMDQESWIEKYNTIHPYSEIEHGMVKAAMKTVPTDGKQVSDQHKSQEPNDTNTVSPTAKWNPGK